MDKPRQARPGKDRRRVLWAGAGVVAVVVLWLLLDSLRPAARSVDADTLWIGTVERGELLREVRGPGTLEPEETRWLAALTEARVERILLDPGAAVEPDTVVLELSNPTVESAARDAEWELTAARADFVDLETRLASDLLDHRAAAAAVEADYREAELETAANRELAADGLISGIDLERSEIRLATLEKQFRIESERLEKKSESIAAQLAAGKARFGQAEALHDLRRRELDALWARAPLAGVLQEVAVEEGEQVSPGTNLARVARPDRLKAELRISEVQANAVEPGQRTRIDTRNGIVPGRVVRVDPSAQGGTVRVEVRLEGELPRGTRPRQSVDGTIEIERLDDVVYVGRPVRAVDHATLGLFKLSADGKVAERVPVELGRGSVAAIEVVSGLAVGDRVILSDMTRYSDDERLRLR